MINPIYFQID